MHHNNEWQNLPTYLPIYLSDCLFVHSSVQCLFYKVWVNQTRYELTKLGTSWPNQVPVDLGGTTWPNNGYELTNNGYELAKVRVDYGTSWPVTLFCPNVHTVCRHILHLHRSTSMWYTLSVTPDDYCVGGCVLRRVKNKRKDRSENKNKSW